MTGGDGARDPLAVRAVLRAALAMLRRHALAFAGLGAAFGVLPSVASLQAVAHLLPGGGGGGDVPALARGALGIALLTLVYLGATAIDVAVMAVALGRGGGRGGDVGVGAVLRLVGRLLPVNASCWVAALVLGAVTPTGLPDLQGVIAAALNSWSIMLPVFVAERVRLRDLPRRSLALMRRRPAPVVLAYGCSFALTAAIVGDPLSLMPNYPVASVGAWARAVAWSGAAFAVQITADAVFAALYLALRRDEGAALDVAVASAFE